MTAAVGQKRTPRVAEFLIYDEHRCQLKTNHFSLALAANKLHILRSDVMRFVPYADGKTIQFNQGTLTIQAVQIAIRCAKRETHCAEQSYRVGQQLECRGATRPLTIMAKFGEN